MNNCIYTCYGFDASLVWVGVEYVYLLIIQVAAFVLAVLNWKVTIKVLNDAKEMMVIVYTSSVILIVLGVFTFVLGTRLILNETLFNVGIFIATTVFLSFTFIPKVSYKTNNLRTFSLEALCPSVLIKGVALF